MSITQKNAESPFCNARGSIELEQARRRPTFWREWVNVSCFLHFKMIVPNISARIEQWRDAPRLWIDGCYVASLVLVTE